MTDNKSILTGVMITAGSTIGAGMFSLPVAASGMWFWYSMVCLLFLWLLNYWSALYILEANLQFEPGASFDTITTNILGKNWSIIIGLLIAFLLYILLYAYYSAFGNITTQTLKWAVFETNHWLQGFISLVFGVFLAVAVWWSTKVVGSVCSILVGAMLISFAVSMFGYAFQIDTIKLFNTTAQNTSYQNYMWAALPYFMTSFGFATIVPSLYKFYGKKPQVIKRSLFGGSLIAFFVYLLFIVVVFGNIDRQQFVNINKAGGNIGHLVAAFENGKGNTTAHYVLNLFSNFAIISSFLGVGLGLFDFIADKFKFTNNASGRLKTAALTFLPPGIASFFFPNGFIMAIGFAGLVVVFALCVIPVFMIRKIRATTSTSIYKVGGGNFLLYFFLLLSLLVGTCKILTLLKVLPKW